MRFSEVVGHGEQIQKLRSMADSGKLPHALLLYGPAGVGKTRTALAFIQYLFCSNRVDGNSCGKCPSCLQTSKLNNPDIHFIFPIIQNKSRSLSSDYNDEWREFIDKYPYMPEEKWLEIIDAGNSRPMIHVAQSEEILRQSTLSSYGDGYKVFLIWLPERMNLTTSNRLLKIIEEPFEDTLFVFISNNPGEILPTIKSRLQSVEFKSLPEEEIVSYFCKEGKEFDEASALARIAKGNMNIATRLVDTDGELKEFMADFMGVMRNAYSRRMADLKAYADKFASYGREKSIRLLDYFSRMIRESFISNLQCPELEFKTPEESNFIEKFGPFINAANIVELSSEIDRAREDISRNANQKIVWFDMFLELTRQIRTKGLEGTKNNK